MKRQETIDNLSNTFRKEISACSDEQLAVLKTKGFVITVPEDNVSDASGGAARIPSVNRLRDSIRNIATRIGR